MFVKFWKYKYHIFNLKWMNRKTGYKKGFVFFSIKESSIKSWVLHENMSVLFIEVH
jgi:hypothetical protein